MFPNGSSRQGQELCACIFPRKQRTNVGRKGVRAKIFQAKYILPVARVVANLVVDLDTLRFRPIPGRHFAKPSNGLDIA